MRKFISLLLAGFMLTGLLSACGNTNQTAPTKRLSVVTTIFPIYDWTKNVLGGNPANMELTLLLDSGVDLHNYQPTAEDVLTVSNCDMFIYVGGESDEWVENILKENTNENLVTINLLEVLGENALEEEEKEGMEKEEDHEEEEGPEMDEHVWLSLKNAKIYTDYIAEKLSEIDEVNNKRYKDNAAAYSKKLELLDSKYREAVSFSGVRTLLFGDRFPFRYMTEDYGLDYYAAFKGCSAETEASFETITFLANKLDELSLNSVMTIEGTNHKIADTIIFNSESKTAKVLSLNSMQGVTGQDVKNGTTYLGIMASNLEVLKEALK
ncbi:MAG: zinc ABC transporter substrate-binding protein [Butyrivibrio sp.]|uniref:metal ABC transporter substrate-binding protein n=1 Tax=Butyrivibrio sp. TaxID=28121 RepID=UPI001B59DDD7|nr:metal ABC transporter substrate-binding protein [Butyrivibrio sp.]MBP3784441.1 zinc ABC transporter substrate-binding protein [Butyrivibrio sp.]